MNYLYEILIIVNNFIEYNYLLSIFIYFFLLTIFFTLSLPGTTIVLLSSGFFFGFILGFLINIFSITIGSFLFIIFSKTIFIKMFKGNYRKYSSKISNIIENSSFEYLILLRLVIGPPLLIQNLCLSLINVSKVYIVLSTFIGFIPIILFLSYLGNYFNNLLELTKIKFSNLLSYEIIVILLLFIFLLILRIYFKKS